MLVNNQLLDRSIWDALRIFSGGKSFHKTPKQILRYLKRNSKSLTILKNRNVNQRSQFCNSSEALNSVAVVFVHFSVLLVEATVIKSLLLLRKAVCLLGNFWKLGAYSDFPKSHFLTVLFFEKSFLKKIT